MAATTATAPPPQQAQQRPPDDDHLIALIVAALSAYMLAGGLVRALRAPFKAAGISGAALAAVAALVASWPHDVLEGTGPASRWAIRTNLLRRAQFFLSACQRVQQAIVAARSKNEPVMDAVRAAITAEQRYMGQHIAASGQRVRAASAVDGMAAMHGSLLGWKAFIDARTSQGCRRADGSNFRVDDPPVIEGSPSFPGAVHPGCRCIAVRAYRGASVLPGVSGRR
jgi:hypothetical protein